MQARYPPQQPRASPCLRPPAQSLSTCSLPLLMRACASRKSPGPAGRKAHTSARRASSVTSSGCRRGHGATARRAAPSAGQRRTRVWEAARAGPRTPREGACGCRTPGSSWAACQGNRLPRFVSCLTAWHSCRIRIHEPFRLVRGPADPENGPARAFKNPFWPPRLRLFRLALVPRARCSDHYNVVFFTTSAF